MMGSGVKKLRDAINRLPLDSALEKAVLEGVDETDDETAAGEAAALHSLFERIPSKLRAIREAVARDEQAKLQRGTAHVARAVVEYEPAAASSGGGRTYEVLFILSPATSEEKGMAIVDELKKVAKKMGAALTTEEAWGKRRLAYPIQKFREGIYYLLVFKTAGSLAELDRRLKNEESVLRHMIVRTDEDLKRAEKLAKRNPKKERVKLDTSDRGKTLTTAKGVTTANGVLADSDLPIPR